MNEIEDILKPNKQCLNWISASYIIECFAVYREGKTNRSKFYEIMTDQVTRYIEQVGTLPPNWPDMFPSDHRQYCDLMSFIHEDNEDLSMKLMQRYPAAYRTIDEPWANWTKIIS